MTKIDALRRFLLPCFTPAAASSAVSKKRLSTSLRYHIQDDPQERLQEDSDGDAAPSCHSDDGGRSGRVHAPPRSSKSMVIGTIFGRRRGHVWFCVQNDRLSSRPALLLELSVPTAQLVKEMGCGLVRLALECDGRTEHSAGPLRSVPHWTVYCNGRRAGYASRRKPAGPTISLLKTMQSISVGAGVIPAGAVKGSSEDNAGGGGGGGEETMYMRAIYECVVGSGDSESFHLINPDDCRGQELSVFLLRTR